MPHRIVIGERGLDNGMLEYKNRRDEKSQDIAQEGFIDFLMEKLGK
ncbi:His/Gly/Thr/Pro-type tRNA ligase C-terminal domain-containing protein [Thiomicrorhabdus sp.]